MVELHEFLFVGLPDQFLFVRMSKYVRSDCKKNFMVPNICLKFSSLHLTTTLRRYTKWSNSTGKKFCSLYKLKIESLKIHFTFCYIPQPVGFLPYKECHVKLNLLLIINICTYKERDDKNDEYFSITVSRIR